MLQGIDHAVILVADLDAAIDDYTRLGFTVVPGGRHTVGTHNALIAFADGAYIELIAFWEDAPQHRWHREPARGGLIDFCMRTDDMRGDVAAWRAAGVPMSAPQPMSRLRPDDYTVEWTLSLATETQGITPFLIEDVTPRQERVPRQVEHANAVTGVARVTVAVPDLDVARRLAPVLGDALPLGEEGGPGLRYLSGGHAFDFIAPGGGPEAARFLSDRPEGGIFALTLQTSGRPLTIEPSQAQNARLTLAGA